MEPTIMHLDSGVLAILGALLAQTVGIVWWAATMTAKLGKTESDVKELGALYGRMNAAEQNYATLSTTINFIINSLQGTCYAAKAREGQ